MKLHTPFWAETHVYYGVRSLRHKRDHIRGEENSGRRGRRGGGKNSRSVRTLLIKNTSKVRPRPSGSSSSDSGSLVAPAASRPAPSPSLAVAGRGGGGGRGPGDWRNSSRPLARAPARMKTSLGPGGLRSLAAATGTKCGCALSGLSILLPLPCLGLCLGLCLPPFPSTRAPGVRGREARRKERHEKPGLARPPGRAEVDLRRLTAYNVHGC